MSSEKTLQELLNENEELRTRLQEAEDTIQAIREGAVDAVIVQGPKGEQVFTLSGEEIIYRRLVETMNEAGLTTSPEGTILFCNERFSRMLRLPMEQILGQSLRQFVHCQAQHILANLLHNVHHDPCKEQIVFKASDGTFVPVMVSANILKQLDSVCICLVAMDLTELEAKNTELQERADQLARLASELTLAENRERHRLAKILHDHIQQLLFGAVLGLEGLGRQVDAKFRDSLTEINSLIKESLNVSRSLTVELFPTILHEGGLAAGLEWLSKWMKDKHGLEVELEIMHRVAGYCEEVRILLFESVRELLFNVVKHAKVSRAKASLCCSDDQIKIVISDQGVGFDTEKLKDSSHTEGAFGLFSIRERLEILGGNLKIESSPDHGTRFTLIAPNKKTKETSLQPDLKPVLDKFANTIKHSASARKIRILVADDHSVVRERICTFLGRETGLVIVGQACDGQQAVDMAQQLNPDIILMDFTMPGLNGLAATWEIRSKMPEVKIIGLSMYDEENREKVMLDAGAAAYVNKCEFDKLIDTIHAVYKSDSAYSRRTIIAEPAISQTQISQQIQDC